VMCKWCYRSATGHRPASEMLPLRCPEEAVNKSRRIAGTLPEREAPVRSFNFPSQREPGHDALRNNETVITAVRKLACSGDSCLV
jgi:hypothetical protein